MFVSPNGADQTTDMVIVDTDILIDAGREVREAVNCLQQIEQKFSLAVSIVTQMELIVGCRNKKELNTLEKFLERFHIIRLDEQISDLATDLLKRYRLSNGLLIADSLIAATAEISNQQLITKNQRHYRFIEDLHLLPYPKPFDLLSEKTT